ncbi:hypothetical protein TgHK011_007753 [Trichoderma gracile]|nr:hypothetical protein TgHK011_007753 [Trichoderma gracile]
MPQASAVHEPWMFRCPASSEGLVPGCATDDFAAAFTQYLLSISTGKANACRHCCSKRGHRVALSTVCSRLAWFVRDTPNVVCSELPPTPRIKHTLLPAKRFHHCHYGCETNT